MVFESDKCWWSHLSDVSWLRVKEISCCSACNAFSQSLAFRDVKPQDDFEEIENFSLDRSRSCNQIFKFSSQDSFGPLEHLFAHFVMWTVAMCSLILLNLLLTLIKHQFLGCLQILQTFFHHRLKSIKNSWDNCSNSWFKLLKFFNYFSYNASPLTHGPSGLDCLLFYTFSENVGNWKEAVVSWFCNSGFNDHKVMHWLHKLYHTQMSQTNSFWYTSRTTSIHYYCGSVSAIFLIHIVWNAIFYVVSNLE